MPNMTTKRKCGDWLTVARGAADARDDLRRAIPLLDRIVAAAGDGNVRDLAIQARDNVYAALVKLVLGLKGRGY